MKTTKTRLVAVRAAELRFVASARGQAPLLLCPLFALLGALPWLSELDPVRLGVSAALLGLSAVIAVRCRPRRSLIVLRPERRELDTPGARLETAEPARITLDLDHDDTQAPRGRYTASVELAGGGSFPILVDSEPDAVLRQLRDVLRHFPGSVECRWGLPQAVEPWRFEPASLARATDFEHGAVLVDERISPIALVRVVGVATALVLLDLTLLVSSQQARLPHVHPLGVALPLAMGTCLLALSVALATRRVRLTAGSWLRSDVGVLGLRSRQRAARVERVRGVYVIGAAAAHGRHILLDTSDGPLAVWVPEAVAEAKAREISRAIEQRSRGAITSLGSITSAPHTSPGA
jgi:hypothetical protein